MDLRNQILEKSEALFLRYGLKSVTMEDIARKLGISKKTLYQFVDNKADLVAQIMMAHIEKEKALMEGLRANSDDAIEEMLQIARYGIQQLRKLSPSVMYDLQKYYQHLWQMVQKLHRVYVHRLIQENIERGIAQGVYRADINPDILAKIYVMSTMSVVDDEVFPIKNYNKENLFIEFIKYHIYGIASPKGLKLYEKHIERKEEVME